MTKQYCRYCAYCVPTLDELAWCEKLEKEMSESAAKRTNSCRDFSLNMIDAFDIGRVYNPRVKKEKAFDNSPLLFGGQA